MIELKPFCKADFPYLIKWIKNEDDLIQFAGNIFTFPLTNNQLNNYLKDVNRNAFKVINTANDSIIGHSEIYFTKRNTVKLCRILIGEPKFRGKGLGQKIVNELLQIAFYKFNTEKVELNVYDWNTSAIKCYKNVGFEIQNNAFKITKINNKIWTAINMYITKSIWEKNLNSNDTYTLPHIKN